MTHLPDEIDLVARKLEAFAPWFYEHRMMVEAIHWLYESSDHLSPLNPDAPKIEQVCVVSRQLLLEVFESAGIETGQS